MCRYAGGMSRSNGITYVPCSCSQLIHDIGCIWICTERLGSQEKFTGAHWNSAQIANNCFLSVFVLGGSGCHQPYKCIGTIRAQSTKHRHNATRAQHVTVTCLRAYWPNLDWIALLQLHSACHLLTCLQESLVCLCKLFGSYSQLLWWPSSSSKQLRSRVIEGSSNGRQTGLELLIGLATARRKLQE